MTKNNIALTNGCFDLLHYGHSKYLSNIKNLTNEAWVIVAVNSDSSILKYKKQLPIIEELERLTQVDSVPGVDVVYLMHDTSPVTTIVDVKPDYYVKGHDWTAENLPEKELLNHWKIKFISDQTTKDLITSTKIKNKIKGD